MDNSENFVFDVICRMQPHLSDDQLRELKHNLYIVLYDYDIKEKETSLAITGQMDNHLIQQKYYTALKAAGRSPETIKRYKLFIGKLLDNSRKPYNELTTDDLRAFIYLWRDRRKNSLTSIDGIRRIYSAFFQWLTDEEYITRNPMRRIGRIKHDTVPEPVYSETDLENLKNACKDKRDRAIVELLESTAIRVTEATRIDIGDIDWKNKSIIVHGKGDKFRTVYFNDKAALYLQKYLTTRTDNNPALFASITNRNHRMTRCAIETMIRKLGMAANVEHAHPHRFRVTKITSLLNRGMPIMDVAEFVGHSDISTTMKYFRKNETHIRWSYLKAS